MFLNENKDVINQCSNVNQFKHVVVKSLEQNLFVYLNSFGPYFINKISFVEYILRILNIIWWSFGNSDDRVDYLYDYHVILEYVMPFKVSINSPKYNNMLSFLTSFFNNYANNYILGNIILQRVVGLSEAFHKSKQFNCLIGEIQKYLRIMRYIFMFLCFIDIRLYLICIFFLFFYYIDLVLLLIEVLFIILIWVMLCVNYSFSRLCILG